MKRYIILLSILVAMIGTSCQDEQLVQQNEIGSQLTENAQHKVSTFLVEKQWWEMPDSVSFIQVNLIAKKDSSQHAYRAMVAERDDKHAISMLIPQQENIEDGDYTLSASLEDGTKLGYKFFVQIQNNMIHRVHSTSVNYSLKGEGTKESPYIIGSDLDFDKFLFGLSKDSSQHAAGLYFKQSADFKAPASAEEYDGNLYKGYAFAGTYDGDGHSIKINYIGSNDNTSNSVGLFTKLLKGATIQNLMIDAQMQDINNHGGALAGESEGDVRISNVIIEGTIVGNESIGAFVGKASGNLQIDDCRISATVSGNNYVGGIVGQMIDGTFKVNRFETKYENNSTSFFKITANNDCAGGLVGKIEKSGLEVDAVTLSHTITQENTHIKVISANQYAGGIAGYAQLSASSHIYNTKIVLPVSTTNNYVGGLIGKAEFNSTLDIQKCKMGAYVIGNEYVGGLMGYNKNNNNDKLELFAEGQRTANLVGEVDKSYCSVIGNKFVGGLFGYIYGDYNGVKDAVTVNIQVQANKNFAGGIAGMSEWCTIDCKHFNLDANMEISAPDAAGGIVGYALNSTVKGRNQDTSIYAKDQPKATQFTSDFKGKVKSLNNTGTSMGGIVGYAKDCYLEYLCATGSVAGTERVGGIVGHIRNESRGHLYYCFSNMSEIKNNGNQTGGIAGLAQMTEKSSIQHCINYSKIDVSTNYAGGIVGHLARYSTAPAIHDCLNYGNITGNTDVGGCIGRIYNMNNDRPTIQIKNMGNFGEIKNTRGSIGGIVGCGDIQRIKVLHCGNHGVVTGGSNAANVGGIAGILGFDPAGISQTENMCMAYCCNRGTISSTNTQSYVGGLLGYQEEGGHDAYGEWRTHDCYNAGAVTSNQKSDNGGIVGCVDTDCNVRYCVNFGAVPHGNGGVGTHKTWATNFIITCIFYLEGCGAGWNATEVKTKDKSKRSSYENSRDGLDFNTVWNLDASQNSGMPYLKNCPFQFKKEQ